MPFSSYTLSPRVIQWLCALSALFLLISGSWAAYTYAYSTIFPPPHFQMSYPPEYYLAQVRTVGTWIFLPIVFLAAILIVLGISLKKAESGSFLLVRVRSSRWFCVLISWIILLVGIVLAVSLAIRTIVPVNVIDPTNIPLSFALAILILILPLFLFVVLNAISTLAVPRRR
jgi:hypothetical protein